MSTPFQPDLLMGQGDWLTRRPAARAQPVAIAPALRRRLIAEAVAVSWQEFSQRMTGTKAAPPPGLARRVEGDLDAGEALGLFAQGGVREDDFVNLRCLAELLGVTSYIESGVFVGSSLFAAHRNPNVERIVAIDPNLERLKFTDSNEGRTLYVKDRDFGELGNDCIDRGALVYFDDHISSTKRVREAHEFGLTHLAFDDSVGVLGITQRLYPATPTIGMLRRRHCLEPGDWFSWTFSRSPRRRRWWKPWSTAETVELRAEITPELLEEMDDAIGRIESIVEFPSLAEIMPLRRNEALVDRTKYYVRLRTDSWNS